MQRRTREPAAGLARMQAAARRRLLIDHDACYGQVRVGDVTVPDGPTSVTLAVRLGSRPA